MEYLITKDLRDLDKLIGKTVKRNESRRGNLNRTQMQILFYLIKHPEEETCQKDLELETHLKKASITGALDSMEDKGVIVRKPSEDDRRKNIIVLSKQAIEEKNKVEERIMEVEKTIRENISEAEIEQFHNIICKIEKNLQKGI